ncbi:hypothetical protein MKEN_01250700 [Mycena kentingensis (nom. inval.)]|nr:hypothetical protein MKEN_01250700 [Mycena kentingensis (nom. inval.)]
MACIERPPSPSTSQARLPADLELQIFTLAALAHRKSIPNMLLVAHRVHTWIEPLLYPRVNIYNLDANDADLATLKLWRLLQANARPPQFFANAVKRLYLFPVYRIERQGPPLLSGWTDTQLGKLLSACSGVQDVALLLNHRDPPLWELVTAANLHPRRLVLILPDPKEPVQLANPLFGALSHLAFMGTLVDAEFAAQLDEGIPLLPRLTHLAISGTRGPGSQPELLAPLLSVNQLQVLILDGTGAWNVPTELRDVRVVTMSMGRVLQWWFGGEDEQLDYWAAAETFVERKRRGDVPESRYFVDPTKQITNLDGSGASQITGNIHGGQY